MCRGVFKTFEFVPLNLRKYQRNSSESAFSSKYFSEEKFIALIQVFASSNLKPNENERRESLKSITQKYFVTILNIILLCLCRLALAK